MSNGHVNALLSLLEGDDNRDFLLTKTGDHVNLSHLSNKIVGLYFASSACEESQFFTPDIAEVYTELEPNGEFEVVFISLDKDEVSFLDYFSTMPWLAVPYSDVTSRERLIKLYDGTTTPQFVLFDHNGNEITRDGLEKVFLHGARGYPYTEERLKTIEEEDELKKKNQTLNSLLVSPSRDHLISNDGKQVPVSKLEGSIVGLYITSNCRSSQRFTPTLVEIYHDLKNKGEVFEVILAPSYYDDEESFNSDFKNMPWLAIPFNEKIAKGFPFYFDLRAIPTLVIIGADGKTLNPNVAPYISTHGIKAYPFSPEKLAELDQINKTRLESQTLELFLVSGELDFVEGQGGIKVPASELFGKTILFYFSRESCPLCQAFTPKLAEVYNKIKLKHDDFEVIFVSSDNDRQSYEDYYSTMPWLRFPYDDEREWSLKHMMDIPGIPCLVAVGPSGKILTKKARELVESFGVNAYPFNKDRIDEMEARPIDEEK